MLKPKRLRKLVYQNLTSECVAVSDFSLAPARASVSFMCDRAVRKMPTISIIQPTLLLKTEAVNGSGFKRSPIKTQ